MFAIEQMRHQMSRNGHARPVEYRDGSVPSRSAMHGLRTTKPGRSSRCGDSICDEYCGVRLRATELLHGKVPLGAATSGHRHLLTAALWSTNGGHQFDVSVAVVELRRPEHREFVPLDVGVHDPVSWPRSRARVQHHKSMTSQHTPDKRATTPRRWPGRLARCVEVEE